MSTVPPVPSAGGIQSPMAPSSGMSGLISPGSSGSSSGPTAQAPDQDEQARAVMNRIRDLSMEVQAMARQYPDCAEAADATLKSLKDVMVKIVSSMQQSAGSPTATPAVLG